MLCLLHVDNAPRVRNELDLALLRGDAEVENVPVLGVHHTRRPARPMAMVEARGRSGNFGCCGL